MSNARRTALILGANGTLGRELSSALLARGWQLRALQRGSARARRWISGERLEIVTGDAMRPADVLAAASGTSLIVHAVNPPRYHNWRGLALPMLENAITAARKSGARLLLPATVYNFAPEAATGALTEEAPQQPRTRKGQVRVEMEQRLRSASRDGVRSLIVRAGDFFGPAAANSWLTAGLLHSQYAPRTLWNPGPSDMGHSWAYVPDLAEAMARLLELEHRLADFEVFHFRGHWLPHGGEMLETICRLRGLDRSCIRPFPWWLVRLSAPLIEQFREMLEMRYLWQVPLRLDNCKLCAYIGAEPHTPLEAALRATLASLEARASGRADAAGARRSAQL